MVSRHYPVLVTLLAAAMAAIRNRIPEMCATTAGEPCIFPFTYKGVEHLDCTYADSTTPWCATMVDFSGKVVTNRWGDCDLASVTCTAATTRPAAPSCTTTGGPAAGRQCVFPFTYNGITYRECAPPVASVTLPWCSTQTFPNGTHVSGAGKYGTCPPSCPAATDPAGQVETCSPGGTWTTACGQTCVCSSSGSPVCTPCPTTSSRPARPPPPRPSLPPLTPAPSSCTTEAGPSAGRPCSFPFTWAGVTYTSCTPWTYGGTFQGKGWCSTATDGDGQHVNGGGNYGFCPDSCRPAVSLRPVTIHPVNQRSRLREEGGAVVFEGPAVGRRPT